MPFAALASFLPQFASAGASLLGGFMQNRNAAKAAQTQMDFQERLSSTAHQREVSDLRAAGLNPILSATGGMGASTAQGSNWQPVDPFSMAANSAMNAWSGQRDQARLMNEFEKITAEVRKLREETENIREEGKFIDPLRRQQHYQMGAAGLRDSTQANLNFQEYNELRPQQIKKLAADTGVSEATMTSIIEKMKNFAYERRALAAAAELDTQSARSSKVEADLNEIPGVRAAERAISAARGGTSAYSHWKQGKKDDYIRTGR